MTVAFCILVGMAGVMAVTLVVAGAVWRRRGEGSFAVLSSVWAATFVASDCVYAGVLDGVVDAGVGRRLVLALTIALAVAQILISRHLFAQWVELILDAYMVGVGGLLLGWTVATLSLGPGGPPGTKAYVVYAGVAAFMLSVLCREMRTIDLPNRTGSRLLIVFAVLRLAGVFTLMLAVMGAAIPKSVGILLIAASYVTLLGSGATLSEFRPTRTPIVNSKLTSDLPYFMVVVAAPVVLAGLAIEDDLRQTAFVVMCALLAIALGARQIRTLRANEALLVRLAERERLYRSLVQDSSDVTMIVTTDGLLEYVSPAAGHVLGQSAEALSGTSAAAVLAVPPDELAAATERILATGTPERLESRRESPSGSTVLESVISRRDDRLLVNVRDVSERAEMREQLQHMAYHDDLTGLPNWHRMHDEIAAALSAAQPRPGSDPALLFVDLDRFKSVNDAAGHAAGDAVLRVVAGRLRSVLPAGALLGRVGGDEFVVLLPPEVAGRREMVAHDIVLAMSEPCQTDHGAFAIGASVGIATAAGATGADDLLRHADLAMYAAKRDLRPWHVYEPTLHQVAVARAAQDRTYSSILDRHSLGVVFQPVVDIATGEPVSCEALVRWRAADGTLGEPGELLDFASRTGRMYDLSVWVLRSALDEVVRWRDAGTSIRVAVNLSSGDVLHPGLAELVRDELRVRELAPSVLGLEITEQVLLGDSQAAMRVCEELRAAGVTVAIDDFGTGFSSLAYLVDLSVDALKIDQSFVRALTRGGASTVIVNKIVEMAHELGLVVIAEGIETQEQRRLVEEAGVRFAQGYLFAGELTGDQLIELVRAHRSMPGRDAVGEAWPPREPSTSPGAAVG